MNKNIRVCPVERAGGLDNRLRRWVQNPEKILRPYIKEGMTVLDMGCGPGFFSVEIAWMTGESGLVIAADLQDGMLQKVKDKIKGTELEKRIILHKCESLRLGVAISVDFALAFYVVHEIPDQNGFFAEIKQALKQNGAFLIVEPAFHVSKSAFEATLGKALDAGFIISERPMHLFSRAALLKKE